MSNLGEFLKEKVSNFTNWLCKELINIDVTTLSAIQNCTPVEAVCLAEFIGSQCIAINHKDWNSMIRFAQQYSYTQTIVPALQELRVRPELHDKFWRYMELFCDVTQNSNTETRADKHE